MDYIEISIRITLPSEISEVIQREKNRFVSEYGSPYKSDPHVTLYLARYTEDGIAKLISDLKELRAHPITFSLLSARIDPQGDKNLYVIDVSNEEQMEELHVKISDIASRYQSPLLREKDQKRLEQGVLVEPKPWFPHITLGGIPTDAPQQNLAEVSDNLKSVEGQQVVVSNITIFVYGKEGDDEKMKLVSEVKVDLS